MEKKDLNKRKEEMEKQESNCIQIEDEQGNEVEERDCGLLLFSYDFEQHSFHAAS